MKTSPEISKVMSEMGKRSAAKLTKAERSARGKKAIQARWEKKAPVIINS